MKKSTYEYLLHLKETSGLHMLVKEGWVKAEDIDKVEELTKFCFNPKFLKRSYSGYWKYLNDYMLDHKSNIMQFLKLQTYKQYLVEIRDMILMNTIVDDWLRFKQAYEFDPDFMNMLIRTENLNMPVDVFHRLPYKTFYIDLENCNIFKDWFGCFVSVSFNGEPSVLPNISILRFAKKDGIEEPLIFSAYLDFQDFMKAGTLHEEGIGDVSYDTNQKLDDIIMERYKDLDVNSEEMKEFISSISIKFHKDDIEDSKVCPINVLEQSRYESKYVIEDNTSDFMMFIMQAIMYLGSYKPEVKKRTTNKTKQSSVTVSSKSDVINISDVGVKYGSTLRINSTHISHRRKKQQIIAEDENSESTVVKKPRKPTISHMRRAHWHTFKVGKGRKDKIVKWIPPIFVCGKNPDNITVHKVK